MADDRDERKRFFELGFTLAVNGLLRSLKQLAWYDEMEARQRAREMQDRLHAKRLPVPSVSTILKKERDFSNYAEALVVRIERGELPMGYDCREIRTLLFIALDHGIDEALKRLPS